MEPSEKRYFKLYASRHVLGEKNNYLKLFEVIANQAVYDEVKIKRALKGETMLRHFSAAKTRLKEMILDALDDYQRSNSPQELLKKQMHQAKLLGARGFKKEALRLFEKIQKRAPVYDLLEFALMAVRHKMALGGTINADLETYAKEERYYVRLIQRRAEYNILIKKANKLVYEWNALDFEIAKAAFDEIVQHPLLQNVKQALTFRDKIHFYSIHALYYERVARDWKAGYYYRSIYLQLFEENEEYIKILPNLYYRCFFNWLSMCGNLDRDVEMFEGLERLARNAKRYGFAGNKEFQKGFFVQRLVTLMGPYIIQDKFEEGLALVPELIEGLDKYEADLNIHSKIHLHYYAIYFYFMNGDYANTLTWTQKILEAKANHVAPQVSSIARILQVMIHYEWENSNFIINLIRNYIRQLKKQKSPFKTEILVLKCLNQLSKTVEKHHKKRILLQLSKALKSIERDPNEFSILNFFPFQDWIKAQLSGETIKKAILSEKLHQVAVEMN